MAWIGLEKTLGQAKSPPRPNGLAWLGLAQIGLGLAWLSGLSRAMHNSTLNPSKSLSECVPQDAQLFDLLEPVNTISDCYCTLEPNALHVLVRHPNLNERELIVQCIHVVSSLFRIHVLALFVCL